MPLCLASRNKIDVKLLNYRFSKSARICLLEEKQKWVVYVEKQVFFKGPLIYSHMAATAAWRDEMQGVACSQGLFSLTRDATQQFQRYGQKRFQRH